MCGYSSPTLLRSCSHWPISQGSNESKKVGNHCLSSNPEKQPTFETGLRDAHIKVADGREFILYVLVSYPPPQLATAWLNTAVVGFIRLSGQNLQQGLHFSILINRFFLWIACFILIHPQTASRHLSNQSFPRLPGTKCRKERWGSPVHHLYVDNITNQAIWFGGLCANVKKVGEHYRTLKHPKGQCQWNKILVPHSRLLFPGNCEAMKTVCPPPMLSHAPHRYHK